ncbi:MAG: efflux RND transporter periplasmic adaptor subunit [Bacteroidetes bacterium]|nr:efflux RND transporter periplasmic adaptor subunit [Bacteroidota bacterium]
MKRTHYTLMAAGLLLLSACKNEAAHVQTAPSTKPVVSENGTVIGFPHDTVTLNFFKTEIIKTDNLQAEITAPARVVATVVSSEEIKQQHLILFDNPDLTATYTALLQHRININQYKTNLDRYKDLAANGAATGKEVIEAQTLLANEQAATIEHEAKLKLAGFNPEALQEARVNSVWVICDIPESQLEKIKPGGTCKVFFTSFPDKAFTGRVEDLGDVVDNITRMVKLRISIENPIGQIKAGMYATVNFGVSEGNYLSVLKSALVTVQSKNYVFIKRSDNEFERKEVSTGPQINDRVIIFAGLKEHDIVVTEGAMQLKGLSFGY